MDIFLRQYGVAATLDFELIDVTGASLKEDAADGGTDCTLSLDDAAAVTATNDFADRGFHYSLSMTAAELTAARIAAKIQDTSAPKVYLDKDIIIETYGHPLSMHPNLGVPNAPIVIHMQLPYAKAATVDFPLFDFAVQGVQAAATFAAGDVKIGKDEGAEGNIGTLPTDRGQTYSMPFTAAELTCARAIVIIKDQTSPALWRDTVLVIHTIGHPSAQIPEVGTPSGVISQSTFGAASTVSDIVLNAGESDLSFYLDQTLILPLTGVAVGQYIIVHGYTHAGRHVSPLVNLPNASVIPASGDAYARIGIPPGITVAAVVAAWIASVDGGGSSLLNAIRLMNTADSQAESTAVPAANASLAAKLSYLLMLVRNKKVVTDDGTTVTITVRNDGDTLDIATITFNKTTGVKTKDV